MLASESEIALELQRGLTSMRRTTVFDDDRLGIFIEHMTDNPAFLAEYVRVVATEVRHLWAFFHAAALENLASHHGESSIGPEFCRRPIGNVNEGEVSKRRASFAQLYDRYITLARDAASCAWLGLVVRLAGERLQIVYGGVESTDIDADSRLIVLAHRLVALQMYHAIGRATQV